MFVIQPRLLAVSWSEASTFVWSDSSELSEKAELPKQNYDTDAIYKSKTNYTDDMLWCFDLRGFVTDAALRKSFYLPQKNQRITKLSLHFSSRWHFCFSNCRLKISTSSWGLLSGWRHAGVSFSVYLTVMSYLPPLLPAVSTLMWADLWSDISNWTKMLRMTELNKAESLLWLWI